MLLINNFCSFCFNKTTNCESLKFHYLTSSELYEACFASSRPQFTPWNCQKPIVFSTFQVSNVQKPIMFWTFHSSDVQKPIVCFEHFTCRMFKNPLVFSHFTYRMFKNPWVFQYCCIIGAISVLLRMQWASCYIPKLLKTYYVFNISCGSHISQSYKSL